MASIAICGGSSSSTSTPRASDSVSAVKVCITDCAANAAIGFWGAILAVTRRPPDCRARRSN